MIKYEDSINADNLKNQYNLSFQLHMEDEVRKLRPNNVSNKNEIIGKKKNKEL
jgi:hypothetical protein